MSIETLREWSVKNGDKIKKANKEWHNNNRGRIRNKQKEWKAKNPDKVKLFLLLFKHTLSHTVEEVKNYL